MKYKIGDQVKIKSLDWYNQNKDENGDVPGAFFDAERTKYCSQVVTIDGNGYKLGSGTIIYAIKEGYEWIGEKAIEGLAEDLKHKEKPSAAPEKVILNGVEVMKALKQVETPPETIKVCDLPNGNVIQAKKIVLEKKKKEYPKTYEECSKIAPMTWGGENFKHYNELLSSFYKLLVCRDAYWKLAGDWRPDYDSGVDKFGICCYDGVIVKTNAVQHWERHYNKVLDFPTTEMRDAFYENFKDLIEECKELL